MAVIVWGVPSEAPVSMVAEQVAATGADVISIAPTAVGVRAELAIDPAGRPQGWISIGDRTIDWSAIDGVYVRPVEPELAPQLRDLPPDEPARQHARRLHEILIGFTEIAQCRVGNRLSAMSSNMSKPLQAQVIARHGFSIPATLVTDDPDEAVEFAERHGQVIYKSISGVRSIVTTFDPAADRDRLARLSWCPAQFQERVGGPDVRVHVVGHEVFAAVVDSSAVDYRYARAQVGSDARLSPYALPAALADRCVALATDLGLPVAGIDLKLSPDGRVVCFEVNPSPGFPWYEREAGLPISAAIARYLTSGPQGG